MDSNRTKFIFSNILPAAVLSAAALGMALPAHAQHDAAAVRQQRRQEMRERIRNMTPEQRYNFFKQRRQQRLADMTPQQRQEDAQRTQEFQQQRETQEAEAKLDWMHQLLTDAGYTDKDLQDSITGFLASEKKAREPLLGTALLLGQGAVNPALTPAQFTTASTNFRAAVVKEEERHKTALAALDVKVHFSTQPRLESILVLLGAEDHESDYVGGAAAIFPDSPMARRLRPFGGRGNGGGGNNGRGGAAGQGGAPGGGPAAGGGAAAVNGAAPVAAGGAVVVPVADTQPAAAPALVPNAAATTPATPTNPATPPAAGGQQGGGPGGNWMQNMTPEARAAMQKQMEKGMQEMNQEWYRDVLITAGYKDKKLQEAVLAYMPAEKTARGPVLELARQLGKDVRDPDKTADQFTASLKALREAVKNDKPRHEESLATLDKSINYTTQPRLDMIVMLFDMQGLEADTVGGTGAIFPDSPLSGRNFGGFGGGGGGGRGGGGRGGGNAAGGGGNGGGGNAAGNAATPPARVTP